jgi:hypothetical protein
MTRQLATKSLPSSRQLIARILDEPQLAAQIQALEAPVLLRLIERVGLEDAGEIVALATTEQLERVFDEDLWQTDVPGEDERFDSGRFLVWLEVMLEAGDSFVAHKLAERSRGSRYFGFSQAPHRADQRRASSCSRRRRRWRTNRQ